MADPNGELRQFAEEALELGFDCISEGDNAPFVLLIETDDQRHLLNLQAINGDDNAALLDSGREVIRVFTGGQLYALVWDGYLTTDEVKNEAVFVEAGKRGEKTSFIFAQKYQHRPRSKMLSKDGSPILVQEAKHLWRTSKSRPEYTSECVYTVLHSKELAAIFRSGRCGTFTEGKKWVAAEKLLRVARSSGQVVPVIFAPGEDIRELTHFAELDAVQISQGDDGKWSTTVSISSLTKIRPPRPKKTQLKVCSTGKKLPANHIRPYVLVHTPSFLKKTTKKK